MRSSQAARRYARALFSMANEDGNLDTVRSDFATLRGLVDGHRELRDALLTPLRPAAERKAVLKALGERASLSPSIAHFVSFLIDQRRLLDFNSIQDAFERLADEATGLLTAEVTAAAPLDEANQERLRRVLAERTGRQIQLEIAIDPELIGGVVAKVGDTLYDGSVRTQLARLQNTLSKEA